MKMGRGWYDDAVIINQIGGKWSRQLAGECVYVWLGRVFSEHWCLCIVQPTYIYLWFWEVRDLTYFDVIFDEVEVFISKITKF